MAYMILLGPYLLMECKKKKKKKKMGLTHSHPNWDSRGTAAYVS